VLSLNHWWSILPVHHCLAAFSSSFKDGVWLSSRKQRSSLKVWQLVLLSLEQLRCLWIRRFPILPVFEFRCGPWEAHPQLLLSSRQEQQGQVLSWQRLLLHHSSIVLPYCLWSWLRWIEIRPYQPSHLSLVGLSMPLRHLKYLGQSRPCCCHRP